MQVRAAGGGTRARQRPAKPDGSGTCALSNDALAPGLSLAGAVTLSGPDYMGSFSNLVPFAIEMAG